MTSSIRIRLEWNVNRSSGNSRARRANISGSSVSIVVFELGTINPSRVGTIVDLIPSAVRGRVAAPIPRASQH